MPETIEWITGMEYCSRIENFLYKVDAYFIPRLSERVCIKDYACKLAKYAETVFFINSNEDIASCSVYCNREIAYISSIAVKPEYMRRGVGERLIDEVKKNVRLKCNAIELHVCVYNRQAINFYLANDFIKEHIKEDWIKMTYYVR